MSYNYNYNRAHETEGKGRKSKDETGECIKLNSEVHEDISLLERSYFFLLCPRLRDNGIFHRTTLKIPTTLGFEGSGAYRVNRGKSQRLAWLLPSWVTLIFSDSRLQLYAIYLMEHSMTIVILWCALIGDFLYSKRVTYNVKNIQMAAQI